MCVGRGGSGHRSSSVNPGGGFMLVLHRGGALDVEVWLAVCSGSCVSFLHVYPLPFEGPRLLSGVSCPTLSEEPIVYSRPRWLRYTHDARCHCFLPPARPPSASRFFVSLANQFGRSSVAMADGPTLRHAELTSNETLHTAVPILGSHRVENVFIRSVNGPSDGRIS